MSNTKKVKGAKVEADIEVMPEISYEYKGFTYHVATYRKWDLDAMEAFEDNKALSAVRALLGPEQWKVFKKTKPTVGDFEDFAEGLFEQTGASAGESEG